MACLNHSQAALQDYLHYHCFRMLAGLEGDVSIRGVWDTKYWTPKCVADHSVKEALSSKSVHATQTNTRHKLVKQQEGSLEAWSGVAP